MRPPPPTTARCAPRRLASALTAGLLAIPAVFGAAPAGAHFQVLRPGTDRVTGAADRILRLDLVFTHPASGGPVMAMEPPARFGVRVGDAVRDLSDRLVESPVGGQRAYTARFEVSEPGDHVFFVETRPYWEPAEGKLLVQHAKVVVDAYAGGGGWDRPLGLPVEIDLLTRPYALWAGGVVRGTVLHDGRPVPHAEVEIEHLDLGARHPPPDEVFATQVVRADAAGVFAFTVPWAGWWGFAALVEGDETGTAPGGASVPVERAGVLWLRATEVPHP